MSPKKILRIMLNQNGILSRNYNSNVEPDSGFGDASYWMQLHEEMRSGFLFKIC